MLGLGRINFTSRLISKAFAFCIERHAEQVRKYNGNPYFYHPVEVAIFLASIGYDEENVVCAALLHDTLEDTKTHYGELVTEFNEDIAKLVWEVSHTGDKGNRQKRWAAYLNHYKNASHFGKIIKLADRICNLWEFWQDIEILKQSDINFLSNVYLRESRDLSLEIGPEDIHLQQTLDTIILILERTCSGHFTLRDFTHKYNNPEE